MPQPKLILPISRQSTQKKRVAAYCRVSSNSADQLNSYARQIKVYSKKIQEKTGWELVEIFADEGISGTRSENRPEFQRMIRMCELRQIDIIITKSISRFARNVKEALEYVRKLKLLGVAVIFEKEGINTMSLGDEMLLNTFSAIAQEESQSISQNMRHSIVKRMEMGEYVDSNAPYGYRLVEKKLHPYEPEAMIVRSIFHMYLNGRSTKEIAHQLNVAGVPTKLGGELWRHHRVSFILRNEKYVGDSLYQKTCREVTVPFRQARNRGQEDMYYAQNTHEGIVDRDAFERVQALYFTRSFTMSDTDGKDVFLCFDGVGYFCRVWLNGTLLCTHEGMFGGPIMEVGEHIRAGENTLTVEVTPPAPDHKFNPLHDERARAQIVPWNLRRDASTSNGDFIVFGIWRSVRIEAVPKTHISRPYLFTKSIEANKAKLHLSVELADPQIRELDVVPNDSVKSWNPYSFAYDQGLSAFPTGKKVCVRITVTEKSNGCLAYASDETVEILDKKYISSNRKYRECQFFEADIEIDDPLLWWPNQLGEAHLYTVGLELYDGDTLLDMLTFDTGIRTIEYIPSSGFRHRTRWDNFHFVINGRPIFLKGMNWMPVDFLLDISNEDYRWALELAKNEGIQLLRVWSGGGMPEDDRFYSLCDELGIMVIQDSFIANQTAEDWNREVLQSQVCQNLYRTRNHPSLALHTGGNEINPYAQNNDAAMWVISREITDLDPFRKFWRTSPDKGSAHIYRDMEPTWYRKIYGQLPFVGESGIHSFPNAKSLRQQISSEEYNKPLSNIFSEEFIEKNPELHNHFTEFIPARIPRMMSRASMISDIRGITLPDLCEATQIASCEFYQIMTNAMRENYPICCGLLPWVFKRAWTTTAIQLVDGLGDPVAPYYYLKNAYAPLSVHLALREVTYAPGETIIPDIRLLCDDTREWRGLTVGCEIYSPALECVRRETFSCDITPEEYQKTFIGTPFTLPEDYTEKYFFLRVYAENSAGLLHQSVYWCKALERMADDAFREQYRTAPQNNIDFDKGPWLKPQICSLPKSEYTLTLLEKSTRYDTTERRLNVKVKIENKGSLPIFPAKLDVVEDKTLSYATDNYFFLPVGNSRELEFEIRVKDKELRMVTLELSAWNVKTQTIEIDL